MTEQLSERGEDRDVEEFVSIDLPVDETPVANSEDLHWESVPDEGEEITEDPTTLLDLLSLRQPMSRLAYGLLWAGLFIFCGGPLALSGAMELGWGFSSIEENWAVPTLLTAYAVGWWATLKRLAALDGIGIVRLMYFVPVLNAWLVVYLMCARTMVGPLRRRVDASLSSTNVLAAFLASLGCVWFLGLFTGYDTSLFTQFWGSCCTGSWVALALAAFDRDATIPDCIAICVATPAVLLSGLGFIYGQLELLVTIPAQVVILPFWFSHGLLEWEAFLTTAVGICIGTLAVFYFVRRR